jgi:sulfur relay (sulfurtransferase) complex TusBCD TusD component (DsrE family)
MESRGITPDQLLEGAYQSSLEELTAWTKQADRILSF